MAVVIAQLEQLRFFQASALSHSSHDGSESAACNCSPCVAQR